MSARRLRVSRFLIVPLTLALLALSVGVPMAAAKTCIPACFQPDVRIRLLGGTLRGNDIYNADGTDQSLTRTVAIGSAARFVITVQNDGVYPDEFNIQATTETVIPPGFDVGFYRGWHPRTEVSSSPGYLNLNTRTLASGEVYHFRSDVRVSADAEPCTEISVRIGAWSAGNGSLVDLVRYTIVTPC